MKKFLNVAIVVALSLGSVVVGSTPMAVAKEPGVEAKASVDIKSYWELLNFANGTHEGTLWNGSLLTLNGAALQAGTDTLGRYNGSAYSYGRYTTGVIARDFREAILSWQAQTPPGTWVEVELSAQVDGLWSKWYSLGVWLEGDTPFKRHSVTGQGDTVGTVATDTLMLKKSATAFRARVTLFTTNPSVTPTVRGLSSAFSNGTDVAGAIASSGLTSDLPVPKRSQMVFPDGGPVWCSPTSTSMVMAYWANVTGNAAWNLPVPSVVKNVWDYAYNGAGNWPYNTAYAASAGLNARVARFSSLTEVEQWTAAGVPVVASIAYKKGQLNNSPIPSSAGHLLVIRGFDANGNVLTNDPAAPNDASVGITYDRLQFEQCWLGNSNGTVYLIHPRDFATPVTNGHW